MSPMIPKRRATGGGKRMAAVSAPLMLLLFMLFLVLTLLPILLPALLPHTSADPRLDSV
jgi:hypothetical protein